MYPVGADARGLRAFGLLTCLPIVLVAHRVLVVLGFAPMIWHDVILVVLGSTYIFSFIIIYISYSDERSSVHAKLVGLSLVTVLLVLQAVSSVFYSETKLITQSGVEPLDGYAIQFMLTDEDGYQIQRTEASGVWLSNIKPETKLIDTGWLELNFEFPFYDQQWRSIYISEKGLITFNDMPEDNRLFSVRAAQAYADTHLGIPKIMPLYTDLEHDSLASIDYSGDDSRMVITWRNLLQQRTGKRSTFQLQLYRDGNIIFVWQQAGIAYDSGVIGITPGGIQPALTRLNLFGPEGDGSEGQAAANGAAVLENLWGRYRDYSHIQLVPMMVVIVMTVALILLIFPWFYQRVITRPMNRLLDGLRAVDQGMLETEIAISAKDEFGFLAEHFNRMTRSLSHSEKTLKNHAAELDQRVQQRTQELAEQNILLEQQWQQLQQVDAAKSRFFANLSHEFRTPLTLTIGPLTDIHAGLHGQQTPEALEQLELATRNSRKVLRLINQILDIAKIEANQFVLQKQMLDMRRFLRDVAQTFTPLAERKNIDFQFKFTDKPLLLEADPHQLEQVITNLLSNAFKFTPEGGFISLGLETTESEDAVQITIRDNGAGIAANQLNHVFERFYQGSEAASLSQAGTGIGLSLSKELVELHDGQVTVQSELGFGSTFTIRLPIQSEPETVSDSASPANNYDTNFEQTRDQVLDLIEESDSTSKDDLSETDGSQDQTTVLVVDDNPDVRSYICKHLAEHYRVVEASDGEIALEKAGKLLPDLVISDVMMPNMDGSTLCAALRHDPELNYVPVILLTARADEADKLRGLELGADDYLAKPFSMPELLVRVNNLIESRRRLKAHYSQPIELVPEHVQVDSADKTFLQRVQGVIEKHLDDPEFNVERLAGAVGQSRGNLHRRVRAILNQTPTDVIRNIRLQRGADLLAQRAGSVSEVAYSVGFKGVAHFSTSFRNKYGVPPSAYAG